MRKLHEMDGQAVRELIASNNTPDEYDYEMFKRDMNENDGHPERPKTIFVPPIVKMNNRKAERAYRDALIELRNLVDAARLVLNHTEEKNLCMDFLGTQLMNADKAYEKLNRTISMPIQL